MIINFQTSYRINLAYSFLLSLNQLPTVENDIFCKILTFNEKYGINSQKIEFHHSKIARRMLISKSDEDLDPMPDLNKQDLYDLNKCDYLIDLLKEYSQKSHFKKFYDKEIKNIEFERINEKKNLVLDGLQLTQRYWDIETPKEITILNNSLRSGGHLDIITNKEKVFLTIDFFNKFDNMIRYLTIHEFSHYFQNRLFRNEVVKEKIKEKEELFKIKDQNYTDWESWFSENLIEATIFSLITLIFPIF